MYRFNLFSLRKQLELKTGKEYSWAKIALGAGLNRNTIVRLSQNSTKGVDLDTLEKLINFFREEGLDVKLDDLIVEVKD